VGETMKKILFTLQVLMFLFLFTIFYYFFLSPNPTQYTAQDSNYLISNCFLGNNNSLECYHLCRNEGWDQDWCKERYDLRYEYYGLKK